MPWQYNAFGLTICSDIELPNLRSTATGMIDLAIHLGTIDRNALELATPIACFAHVAKGVYWFYAPGIAHFEIRDGKHIIVEPDEGADPQSIRLYLLGSAIGACIHQRGQLVLHANAIQFGDQCVIFAGNSGNGKSTLAAGLYQKGYPVLSDDLVVIDRHGLAQPSYPQLKLWQDAAHKLNIDTARLVRIRVQVEKFAYPLSSGFCDTPLPVAAMYLLHTHNLDEIRLEEVHGIAKFTPLKNHTYRSPVMKGLGLQGPHLKLCSQLANRIPIKHITRPSAGFQLDGLISSIEDDLRQAGIL